jgi:Txe/YoeB family toxin of Txe-Axe toxin-antitoxin module
MKSKINEILKDIEIKKKELFKEYEKLKCKYEFSFNK